jgi:hypothetical protein
MKKAAIYLFSASILLMALPNLYGQKLTKIWETDAVFDTPESVLVDMVHKCMYVTNIGGKQAWAKDGYGFISKLSLDGKIIDKVWVKGLNAPKGMAIVNHMLYVADVDKIVEIDIHKGKIKAEYPVAGAMNLNDVAPLSKKEILFSDSGGRAVYKLAAGKYQKMIDSTSLKRPNGVLVHGKSTLVLDNNAVNIWSAGKLTMVVDGMPGGVDGIEPINANEFLVSCWSGTVYHVDIIAKTKKLLLDTTAEKKNAADIGWDKKNNVIYVPTFYDNRVVAYQYSK